jgi:ribosomal protein S18 acetylase RimI-like enzyme
MKFDVLINRIINESGVIKLRGKSQNPKVIEYKNIVYSWGVTNPISDKEVLIDNCLLKLEVGFNGIYIEHIRTLPEFKNKGYASRLLKKLIDLADKMNIKLSLHAKQTNEEGLSIKSLKDWYKRYGFEYKEYEDGEMIRYPN